MKKLQPLNHPCKRQAIRTNGQNILIAIYLNKCLLIWDEQIHQSLNNECLKIKYTNKTCY